MRLIHRLEPVVVRERSSGSSLIANHCASDCGAVGDGVPARRDEGVAALPGEAPSPTVVSPAPSITWKIVLAVVR